jgi:hypothetical protein
MSDVKKFIENQNRNEIIQVFGFVPILLRGGTQKCFVEVGMNLTSLLLLNCSGITNFVHNFKSKKS